MKSGVYTGEPWRRRGKREARCGDHIEWQEPCKGEHSPTGDDERAYPENPLTELLVRREEFCLLGK